MDTDARVDELVAPLRADTVSGAAVVAGTAAEVLRRAAVRIRAGSLEELRWGLGEVAMKVLDAQPSMAPLVRLLQDVLAAVEAADTLEGARHAAANAAEEFRTGLDERAEAIAARTGDVLPTEGMVATISSSSTVRTALLRWVREGDGPPTPDESVEPLAVDKAVHPSVRRVLCFESRPMAEGRDFAEALAREGVDVTFAVDAAAYCLLPACSAVLLGADSIGDRGVVNKIGSVALAHAADVAAVPVHVLCDETKVLPRGFPQIVEDDRPGSDVWEAPSGVTVWNRYFEVVPLDLVAGVVTEHAVLAPAEVEVMRGRMEFPRFLKRWAEGR